MNIIISDPKTGKAYSAKAENLQGFAGKKVGQIVKLDSLGLNGFEAKITGGSDKQGFPMKDDLPGTVRKKVFVVVDRKNGTRKRITRRGNIFTEDISQMNVKITKEGDKKISEVLVPAKKEEKEASAKEAVVKASGHKK